MRGRPTVKYDFLQVTDEMLDQRASALARLLTASGRRTSPGDALWMILRLERHVLRHVNEEAPDAAAEIAARSVLARDRAAHILAEVSGLPLSKWEALVDALCDEDVGVLEECPGGWRVRNIPERYARFANERRAARHRARDTSRAKAAGWESGEGRTWVNRHTGEVLPSLREVMEVLNG